ncbi:MAG TPA: guanylate kinase [Syntrophales bacterium]|nr:guanylate kinase [Syntrophales bacterium]HPX11657.1 guanylate kinase [Syntrophales bacterium]HQB31200.1 guanylate kinase [Syntrophales bacterium]HQN79363.1 guanylate kinase [Syntrophales bacterium]HQQ28594.1 guanylate kinase [Syntrophales bacterium]
MESVDPSEQVVLVVSAPSGGGKTTLCREFLKAFPGVSFSVSSTTRPPRPGEVDGKDYRFISTEEFRRKIEEGAFVEWAENFGHFYGTLADEVERPRRLGMDVLLDVDTRGAKSLRARFPEGVFIFILPPSIEVLKERLSHRGSEGTEALRLRISRAMDEIQESVWYDYLIINEDLRASIEALKAVYTAEKVRVKRQGRRLRPFLRE